MASENSQVSSAALIELESDLTKLSHTLHEIFELMNADMTNVGEFWRDPKYQDFVAGYRPQINKCEEISARYDEWCKKVLRPTIEKVIKIETTDVGGDAGGATSSSSGGGVIEDTPKVSKAAKFNMGKKKVEELNNAATTPGPQGSGFSTPQNERPYTPTPQQINDIFNGKRR